MTKKEYRKQIREEVNSGKIKLLPIKEANKDDSLDGGRYDSGFSMKPPVYLSASFWVFGVALSVIVCTLAFIFFTEKTAVISSLAVMAIVEIISLYNANKIHISQCYVKNGWFYRYYPNDKILFNKRTDAGLSIIANFVILLIFGIVFLV